jgi:hypothetical protein
MTPLLYSVNMMAKSVIMMALQDCPCCHDNVIICQLNVKFQFFKIPIWCLFFNLLSLTRRLCSIYTTGIFFYFMLFCLVYHLNVSQFFFFFGLFRFLFLCFGSFETPKHAVSILNRKNRNKRLVPDSVETSFGSSFGCFESKLVS